MDINQMLLEIVRERELGMGNRKKAQVIVCIEQFWKYKGNRQGKLDCGISDGRQRAVCDREMERGLGREQECYRRETQVRLFGSSAIFWVLET